MSSVSLSSKGQLVLPKPLRDALRLSAGDRLRVEQVGERIVLEPARRAKPAAWAPLNPAGARLGSDALCRPVDLRESRRR